MLSFVVELVVNIQKNRLIVPLFLLDQWTTDIDSIIVLADHKL